MFEDIVVFQPIVLRDVEGEQGKKERKVRRVGRISVIYFEYQSMNP